MHLIIFKMELLNSHRILSKKCEHPKVLHILHKLAPPSPVIVPRDHSQPRVGNLLQLQNQNISNMKYEPISIEKPQLKLSLDSSFLKRRRDSRLPSVV